MKITMKKAVAKATTKRPAASARATRGVRERPRRPAKRLPKPPRSFDSKTVWRLFRFGRGSNVLGSQIEVYEDEATTIAYLHEARHLYPKRRFQLILSQDIVLPY